MIKTFLLFALLTSFITISQNEKCKEKEVFSILSNYKIDECYYQPYDVLKIYVDENAVSKAAKKGEYTKTVYRWKDKGAHPSKVFVLDNFKAIFKKEDIKILYEGLSSLSFSFKKTNQMYWGHVEYYHDTYTLQILKEKKLTLSIKFNEKHLKKELIEYGRSELKGVFFDTDKSTLKPTSTKSLTTIANYLNANPNTKVFIVGHTDNAGDFTHNQQLSKARANAVVSELVEKHQVNASQLRAFGIANLSPKSIDKNKNRRVEMVLAN
ncbi:OmpA family protein [Tenacibaculum sp. 190524A02b]|uniref:OmpA family protein n=1 Tax=Tenacibaculum vairaonense TaxID=3137860 RepID=UPI0031FB6453